ncbi:MAG: phage tail tape measure protein [Patescibacteria group bacterium]
MAVELFKLFGSILIKDEDALKSLDHVDKKGKEVHDTSEKMGGSWLKTGGIIAAGVGAAVAGMWKLAESTSKAAGDLFDMSERTGLNTDTLQELQFQAEQTGVKFDSITSVIGVLTKNMASAAAGSKGTSEAFKTLGVNVKDNEGNMKSLDSVFPQVLAKLADMKNETERNQLAFKVFGKGALELVPLLTEGSAGIKGYADRAHELGIVMSGEAIKAGDDFGDSLNELKKSFEGVKTQLGSAFIPIIQKLIDSLLPIIKTIMPPLMSLFKSLGETIIPIVTGAFQTIMPIVKPILDALMSAIKTLSAFVKGDFAGAWKSLQDTFNGVWQAISAVFNTVVNGIIGGINLIIDAINTVTGSKIQKLKEVGKEVAAVANDVTANRNTSGRIPMMAEGGIIAKSGLAYIAEAGPELVRLSAGAEVIPLDKAKTSGINVNINYPILWNRQNTEEVAEQMVDILHGMGIAVNG